MTPTRESEIPVAVRPRHLAHATCPVGQPRVRPATSSDPVRRATAVMGTFLHIELYGPDHEALHHAADRAFALARRLSWQLSRFEPGGEVGRLNAWPAHRPFEASLRLRRLLSKALHVWRASDGAFDPTPQSRPRRGPAIRICGTRVIREDPDAQIDLGAIAKGFIIDEIVQLLRRSGVTDGLVNAGGDIRAFGDRTWNVQLRHPHRPGNAMGDVALCNAALCVSAETFQPGHIRDPRHPGMAEGTTTAGTAVIARLAADADAWATALFVSGGEGLRRWFFHRTMAGLVIESSDTNSLRLWRTKNFPIETGRGESARR